MDEDEEKPKLSRCEAKDQQRMRQFLDGTLHLNSSMRMTRNGKKLTFALQGSAQRKLQVWWQAKEEIHPSQRRAMVQLIVHKEELSNGYQLVRDLSHRVPPLTRVQVTVTPAKYFEKPRGVKRRNGASIYECKPLPGAPTFYLQDIAGKDTDKNLLQFIIDTVSYKEEQDRVKAEQAANVRPFITPKGEDPTALPKLVLPTLSNPSMWLEQQSQSQDFSEGDLNVEQNLAQEAQKAVWQAFASQQSNMEVFNDDQDIADQGQDQPTSSLYNPTVLLSPFALPLSQHSSTDSEAFSHQTMDTFVSATSQVFT